MFRHNFEYNDTYELTDENDYHYIFRSFTMTSCFLATKNLRVIIIISLRVNMQIMLPIMPKQIKKKLKKN